MKKTGISLYGSLLTFLVVSGLLLMSACNILSSSHTNNAGPIVTGVRDIHPDSAAVSKIGPGETVVIQGKNLSTTKEVYFDGYATTINQTLYSDTTVIATIPANLPFGLVKSDSLNTIHVVTKYGETIFKFPVLPPAPVITYVSNEFANAGTNITISGQYLYFVKSVTFPGGINASKFSSKPDGSELTVTVPSGVTQTGGIKVVTDAGSALSSPNHIMNDKSHVFLNFDDKNGFTPWGPKPVVVTTQSQVPDISMLSGDYLHWTVTDTIPVGTWWVQDLATPTDGSQLAWPSDIPASTSASKLALKFEVNFPGKGMSSGEIKLDFNFSNDYFWKPWENAPNGTFKTDGWQTITIPLSDFSGVVTYGDIKGGSFNIFYDNGNGTSNVPGVSVGWDNFRIVPQ